MGTVSVDVVAVVAQALVHAIEVQVDVFIATEYSAFQALCVCLVCAGKCVEVLVVVIHFGILPPVSFYAKESYLVLVSTSWDSSLRVEFAQTALRSFIAAIPALVESFHPVMQTRLQDEAAKVSRVLCHCCGEVLQDGLQNMPRDGSSRRRLWSHVTLPFAVHSFCLLPPVVIGHIWAWRV